MEEVKQQGTFTNCKECGTPEYCKKENSCSKLEYERAAAENIDWHEHTKSLLGELRNLNYLKENNLVIQIMENKKEKKIVLNLRKKDKLLYTRMFEGDSEEVKYQLVYFFYMDILNQGLMMMDKLQIEQDKLDKEKGIVDKVQGGRGKIVGLDGKAL